MLKICKPHIDNEINIYIASSVSIDITVKSNIKIRPKLPKWIEWNREYGFQLMSIKVFRKCFPEEMLIMIRIVLSWELEMPFLDPIERLMPFSLPVGYLHDIL